MPPNILLITFDQFRGDCLSCAGHPVVRTPHLDALAAEGLRLARHYSQAAPCGPGRASLYTGLYQMNHRVAANGSPLDDRFDNLARAARRAGYVPTLFGYTDQAIDPRITTGPEDPRLRSYEEVLPGFEVGVHLTSSAPRAWLDWLRDQGFDPPHEPEAAFASETGRPAEASSSAFLVEALLDWAQRQDGPWFAHLSLLRPHPPYAAAGGFASLVDPDDVPASHPPKDGLHRLYDALRRDRRMRAPDDPAQLARLKAQYFGMVAETDWQFGRLRAGLEALGAWDDAFVVVTSDHGEHLGDHGLVGKGGFFEESQHILGLARDPRPGGVRGAVVERFTENVDIFPTLCEAMEIPVPLQCDGLPLTPFLQGREPPWWREAAHWEFDARGAFISTGAGAWPWDRRLERRALAVRRDEEWAYVHFADGSWLCFDLAAAPDWSATTREPAAVLPRAQALLDWRARHAERILSGMIIDHGPVGRLPPMPAGWGERRGA